MDNNEPECHRPCKRKRTSSCTIQDTPEVKVQTEGGCSADVSQHDSQEDNTLFQNEFNTENGNFSNDRFGHGESIEVPLDCNEVVNDETGEVIHVPISIHSAENFDEELIVQHGSVSSFRYKETPFDVASSSNNRASGSDVAGSSSEVKCSSSEVVKSSSLDFRHVFSSSSDENIENQISYPQKHNLIFLQSDPFISATCSSSSGQYDEGMPSNDNNENTLCSINKLPPNILVHIFRNLSIVELLKNVCLVCRTWYQLSRDPELWRFIDLRRQERVTDSALMTLTSYSDRVIYLDLTDTKELSCEGIMNVIKKCKHLQTLKLSRFFPLTDEVLEVIGESCHKLQHLLLEICFRITNNGIQKVAEGCPDLIELQLTQCKKINDDGVMVLAEKCHQLKQLMVDHCGGITDKSVIELTVGCPLLEYLTLTTCNLTDKSIHEIKNLQNLKVLDISSIPSITPTAVLQVVKNCKLLECINLSLNPLVDDKCIEMVAKYGTKLKRLYCVSCALSDKGLEMIGQHSKTIQHLDVGWCQGVTDEGVRTISLTCPSLRYLGLIRCDNVTIATMEELVERYPHIEYSTFVLASMRLIERARQQGFRFDTS